MSSIAHLSKQLSHVLTLLGRDPAGAELIGGADAIDEETLFTVIGETARACGYPAAADPATPGDATRVLQQLARDRIAERLTDKLPRKKVPHGFTLGTGGYVLYLRSFGAPLTTPIVPTDLGRLSLEEILAFYCEQSGPPLIGLGRLDSVVPGAGKLLSTDADWQDTLRTLSLNADVILAVPSATAGTSWEIEWVAINDNLRNSVFLMPPVLLTGDTDAVSRESWKVLQRWARFMGLLFPDYDDAGLLFTMNPNGHVLRSVTYQEWASNRAWYADLIRLCGTSSDWLWDTQRSMLSELEVREAKERNIDLFTLYDEIEGKRRASIRANLAAVGRPEDARHYQALERLDTVIESTGLHHGTRPGLRLSEWPPPDVTRYDSAGAFTVWYGTKDLIWSGSAANLGDTLALCASGDIEHSDFCRAVFTGLVEPSLRSESRRELDEGRLDRTKMTQFFIHKNLSVLSHCTATKEEAQQLADLVRAGALSLGKPRFA